MQKLIKQLKNNEIIIILSCFVVLITLILISKDYLASMIFATAFDLSESLLFKTTIVLFLVPVFMFNYWKHLTFEHNIDFTKIITYLIPACLLHIIIASWSITFIAQYILNLPLTFWSVIKILINQDLVFLITVYGLMFLLARYYSLNLNKGNNEINQTLSVRIDGQRTTINIIDIDWIGIESSYLIIWVNHKKYQHSSSIEKIINKLNSNQFIRINPSTIVNQAKIEKIHTRPDGDFDIYLKNSHKLILNKIYKNILDRNR